MRFRRAMRRFARALRKKNAGRPRKDSSEAYQDEDTFTIRKKDGGEAVCRVLFTFDHDDGKHYIVYTDDSKDEEGKVCVYASVYEPHRRDRIELSPIETQEEWAMIEQILAALQEKIRNGEPVDDVLTETGAGRKSKTPKALAASVGSRAIDWMERHCLPVHVLLPYILGAVFYRVTCPDPLPVRADIAFALIELMLLKTMHLDADALFVPSGYPVYSVLFLCGLNNIFKLIKIQTGGFPYGPTVMHATCFLEAVFCLLMTKRRKQRWPWTFRENSGW